MSKRRRIFETSGPSLSTDSRLLTHLHTLYPSLNSDKGQRDLAKAMSQLHEGLTTHHDSFVGDTYLEDPQLRFAYDAYMLCVQSPKLIPILEAVKSRLISYRDRLHVADIGCGTATAAIATSLWMSDNNLDVEFTCIDHSHSALKRGRTHLDAMHRGRHVMQHTIGGKLHERIYGLDDIHLAILMNVVNEIDASYFTDLGDSIASGLRDDGLLILIEPSTKKSSRHAIGFRECLLEKGWQVVLPCAQSRPCPMVARQGDWCHDTWRYERPDFIEAVDRLLGLRREILKATWFVLSPPNAIAPPIRDPLVIGERVQEKGRSVISICDGERLSELELQKKDVSEHNTAFLSATRYDRLECSEVLEKGRRLRLKPSSSVRVLPLSGTSGED